MCDENDVIRDQLKEAKYGDVTLSGSAFQARPATTGSNRSLRVVRVLRMNSATVEVERNRRLDSRSDTRWTSQAK